MFTSDELGFTYRAFQHFSQEYSDSSILVALFIYSFMVFCSYHVLVTSFSTFYFILHA